VRSVAREVLDQCGVVAGVALVENQFDETAKIAALAPDDFEEGEKELLLAAKQMMPTIPFEQAHLMLIDQIGKDVSGSGMDTNIVGRKYNDHQAVAGETPQVRFISIRGLTEATHGNATGLGLAEFCRSRVIRETDQKITRINCITGGHVIAAMMPLDYESDQEIMDVVLQSCGLTPAAQLRLIWVRNTLDVAEFVCSEVYWDEVQQREDLTAVSDVQDFPFDAEGNWPDNVHDALK